MRRRRSISVRSIKDYKKERYKAAIQAVYDELNKLVEIAEFRLQMFRVRISNFREVIVMKRGIVLGVLSSRSVRCR